MVQFLSSIVALTSLLIVQSLAFRSSNPKYDLPALNSSHPILPRAGEAAEGRAVYAVADITFTNVVISPRTGNSLLYGHSFLFVEGSGTEGALRIEHIQTERAEYAIRIVDYGAENNNKRSLYPKATTTSIRQIHKVGTTSLTNAQFTDPQTGKGLVLDVWARNPTFRTGTNCCNQLVQNLVKALGLKTPPPFDTYVSNAKEFAQYRVFPIMRSDLPIYVEQVKVWGAQGTRERIGFDTTDLNNPRRMSKVPSFDTPVRADTAAPLQGINPEPLRDPWVPAKVYTPNADVRSPFSQYAEVSFSESLGIVEAETQPLLRGAGASAVDSAAVVHDSAGSVQPPKVEAAGPVQPPKVEAAGSVQPPKVEAAGPVQPPKVEAAGSVLPDSGPSGSGGSVTVSLESSGSGGANTVSETSELLGSNRGGSAGGSGSSAPVVDSTASTGSVWRGVALEVSGPGNSGRLISSVRIGGITNHIGLIASSTLKGLGIAGLAAAPLFIILDFVNGNPVGGAFGVASLALGILAMTAFEGPVGWLVGGIAAFFAIIPSMFGHATPDLPRTYSKTEIIQFAMFGDRHHTGNEKCREQNPNCTAVYGPGVLSLSFGWNNFDPIAFLLQYNNGYPMTIPEMADAFTVVESAHPEQGNGKIATIICKPKKNPCGRAGCSGPGYGKADTSMCSGAEFKLKRELITLPTLNSTADKVFDRIIPKLHGDCKLVNEVSGIRYEAYNVTVTGAPAAIACGISPAWNVNGLLVPTNDTDAANGLPLAFIAPTNQSTDGNSHDVAAPFPATGFITDPLNSTNAVCLSDGQSRRCFPSGSFPPQKGIFGFKSKEVSMVDMPAGASLNLSTLPPGRGKAGSVGKSVQLYSYRKTISQPDQTLNWNFGSIEASHPGPNTFDIDIPSSIGSPPIACFHSSTKFKGDVICLGVGTGNVTSEMKDVPESISFHGGASAWIYGRYYGDDAGQKITMDVADLSTIPLGTDENFSKKLKGLWISAPDP